MKVLALDFGLKRIGVAIGSSDIQIAFARTTLQNNESGMIQLAKEITNENIETIIIGNPVQQSGEDSPIIDDIHTFYDLLTKYFPHISIQLYNEQYSTKIAEKRTRTKKNPFNKGILIDSYAAQVFLENFLTGL
ncbi:Holliday junction resolvase RuvX [Candidatus Peregrinibacteria bacterium]|nr:MAG: Holliday junction resolvase RuvX [Candidatus Peregrinibacteria bacterium]